MARNHMLDIHNKICLILDFILINKLMLTLDIKKR